ncbi:MAG TPA: alpha/beta fold hydrolase, partial [Conexibacter sp.]|nr:alpha/beta fold hydrolase [Conexibacter sp.]
PQRRVVAYDRRANSRSGRPPSQPGVTGLAEQADDARAVLDRLGIERAAVLGTSGGGCIALELARRHPQRVERLLLHEPALVHALPDGAQLHAALSEQLRANSAERGPEAALEAFLRFAYGDEPWELLPAAVARRILANGAVFVEQEFEALTSARPPAPGEWLPRAVLLRGTASPPFLTPLCERVADVLAAPVRIVPGGHLGYFTHPGPFAQALLTATEENR